MSASEKVFRMDVSYSVKGFKSHSFDALRKKCGKIAEVTAAQSRLFRNGSKLKGKLKNKFNKLLKKLNIVGEYRVGKKFYKCNFHELNKGLSQGIILNNPIKNATHLVDLTPKSPKEIFFVSSQVEVVALQGILSKQAHNGQKYVFMLHEFAPLNITPQCKMGGIPCEDKLKRGAKFAEARAKLGTHFATYYEMIITGRSCTLFYDNEEGKKVEFLINNPCSRTDYGSGEDGKKSAIKSFQEKWESTDLPSDYPAFSDIEADVKAYFVEMKNISREYLPYFVGDPSMTAEKKNYLNEKYWSNQMKVSTNLVNLENISGAHVDTAPETYDFFTMLSLQSNEVLNGEGELAFPGLGFRIQYQTGDVILMRPDIYHGICSMKSGIDRYSAVFYNNFTKVNL